MIVATHLNTGCLHNHFVLNSVSFLDGKRYNDCKTTYREFRRLSDEICREYGLSVVENPQKSKTPRDLYLAEKPDCPPGITSCGRTSTTPSAVPLPSGFSIRSFSVWDIWYAMIPNGSTTPCKSPVPNTRRALKRWGRITPERPSADVFYKTERPAVRYPRRLKCVRLLARIVFGDCISITAICWVLSVKIPTRTTAPPSVPKSARRRKYSEQARLLCREQIDTAEQLLSFIEKTQEKIPALVEEREQLYKQISRCEDNNQLPGLIQHRDALTEAIGKLRKDLKNAKLVMERNEKTRGSNKRARTKQKIFKKQNSLLTIRPYSHHIK